MAHSVEVGWQGVWPDLMKSHGWGDSYIPKAVQKAEGLAAPRIKLQSPFDVWINIGRTADADPRSCFHRNIALMSLIFHLCEKYPETKIMIVAGFNAVERYADAWFTMAYELALKTPEVKLPSREVIAFWLMQPKALDLAQLILETTPVSHPLLGDSNTWDEITSADFPCPPYPEVPTAYFGQMNSRRRLQTTAGAWDWVINNVNRMRIAKTYQF